MAYVAEYQRPYEGGYVNLPSEETPEKAEFMNARDDTIIKIEQFLANLDLGGLGEEYALLSESGYSLGLDIDSNYIMTISLKNKAGEILDSKNIDFPIESVVVNATYENGKIILSLQNGNSLPIDISDMVRGLVPTTRKIAGIDLTDDITKEELVEVLGISSGGVSGEIPTKVSQLENDLGYVTQEDIIGAETVSAGEIKPWLHALNEEVIIGVYNGKPLYRTYFKMIVNCKHDSYVEYAISDYVENVEHITNYTVFSQVGDIYSFIYLYEPYKYYERTAHVLSSSNKIRFTTSGASSALENADTTIMIEYTKTTDTEESGNDLKPYGIYDAKLDDIKKDIEELQKLDITETTETTMPNSYDGRLLVKEIGGVCKQVSTSGANLINQACVPADATQKHFLKAGAYTVSRDASEDGGAWYIGAYESDGTAITKGTLSIDGYSLNSTEEFLYGGGSSNFSTFAITKDCYVKAGVLNGSGKTYLMLNAGTTALPYEPYTGGLPSPSPSYPQEIKKSVVSGIKTHGKNLLNINKEPYLANHMVNHIYGFYKVETCDVYKIDNLKIGNIYLKIGLTEENISVGLYKNDGTLCYAWKYLNRNNLVINNDGTADYMLVTVRKGDNAFMVSYEDTPYEPYVESAITLSQPINLYKIGDVQDVITPKQIKRKFAKVVFDGSEQWFRSAVGRFYTELSTAKKGTLNCICDSYRFVNKSHQSISDDEVTFYTDKDNAYPNQNWFYVCDDSYSYATEFVEKLKVSPITVVYELAEEVIENLPLADQIALNSLATYDGITYLEFDSEIEPTFEGEYGTSKVGGYTLDGMLAGRNGELMGKNYADRITALESTVVNNI